MALPAGEALQLFKAEGETRWVAEQDPRCVHRVESA